MNEYQEIEMPNGEILEFPAHMSEDEISNIIMTKYEHAPQQKSSNKGWPGVWEDIKGLPDVARMVASQAYHGFPGQVQGIKEHPRRIPQNLLAGTLELGRAPSAITGGLADYLSRKELISPEAAKRFPHAPFTSQELAGIQGEEPGDILTQLLPGFAPGGAIAGKGAQIAGKTAKTIGSHAKKVPGMIGQKALSSTAKMLRGPLSLEEIVKNMAAAEGTHTPLGDILGNPTLKHVFENMTADIPFGKGGELTEKIAGEVESKAKGLLDETDVGLGHADRNDVLKQSLESAYGKQKEIKNELYKPVNELASAEGFSLDLPSFKEKANEVYDELSNSPLFRTDKKFASVISKLAGIKNPEIIKESLILGPSGQPIKEIIRPSILEVNMTSGKLYDEGRKMVHKGASAQDRAIGNVYLDLSKRLKNDLNDELKEKGSPFLKSAYAEANTNYKENFSQFLDSDIYKLLNPEYDAQSIIRDIIQPGKAKDKYTRIEKIQRLLPEDQKNLMGNAWLRNAIDKEGDLNPKQFSNLINQLGTRQFEALFPDPEYRQKILNYGRLRGMNEKSLSRMANPMTGQSLKIPGMVMGQVAGVTAGAATGNLPMAVLSLLGPPIGARMTNKLLTSPKVRNKLIDEMIKQEETKSK